MRDIAGFFRDCGCSGSNVGGITRLPNAAGQAKSVDFLFVGRTLLPHVPSSVGDSAAALMQAQSAAIAATGLIAFQALDEMGDVYWITSDNTYQHLRDVGVNTDEFAPFRTDSLSFRWRRGG